MPSNPSWVQVSAGEGHTCGLQADGTLACWGRNDHGQTTVPGPNANWVQVSAGRSHTCGLQADGTLVCWGDNTYGQASVPSNPNWVQVSAGDRHTCGLKADGTLVCWGDNTYGQASVPSNPNWVQVSAGDRHTCGLKADGTLACWGQNGSGQTTVPSNPNWVQVSAGWYHTCGLQADGTLACWGDNHDGRTTVPSPNTNWVQVSAGRRHTCGLKADGTLVCWGYNHDGEAPVVTLAPATLPNATLGVAYTQNLSAGGGSATPYTFSVLAGAVPPGLALNANGTWSGIPTAPGTFNFTAQAKDANNIAGTRDYALTVDCFSAITVANANDSGAGSLRQAIASSCPGGTITFGGDYTIPLASTLAIARNLTIEGAGRSIRLEGQHAVGVLSVNAGVTLALRNLAIVNGSAGGGGGLNNSGGTVDIVNCTFAGNSATGSGGAVVMTSGSVAITNSTFSGNSATGDGAALYNDSGTLTVRNTILANSPAGGNCGGAITNGGANLEDGATCGFGSANGSLSNTDPRLAALTGGVFPLNADSPAIDAADAAYCPTTDQRGQPRNDLRCDIGAFERVYSDGDTVSKAVAAGGTYTFGPTMVKIVVSDTGGCLAGITVQRTDANHPNASAALQTGHWWAITTDPVGCTGFNVDLTLPTDAAPAANDLVCRYIASAAVWDCGRDAATPTSITRNGVTTLSDWTVGRGIQPAAAPAVAAVQNPGSSDVSLSWTDNAANTGGYLVWYSETPYFSPEDPAQHVLRPAGSIGWTHTGVAGDPAHNYYYIVQGINAAGVRSGPSNRTGAFGFRLIPDTP